MCRKFYIAQAAELDLTAVEGTKEVKNSLTQTSVSEAVFQSWQIRLWVSEAKNVITQLLQQNQLQTAALPFAADAGGSWGWSRNPALLIQKKSSRNPATALLLQATRTIYHFHYKNWPDHHVPSSIEPILELIRDIRCYQPEDRVPVCIHCRWVSWLPAGKGCWPPDPGAATSPGATGQGRWPSP